MTLPLSKSCRSPFSRDTQKEERMKNVYRALLGLVLLLVVTTAHASSVETVSINGTIPSSPTTTLTIDLQASEYNSPLYHSFNGRVLMSGRIGSQQVFIYSTKIIDVTANMATGVGTVTAEYVLNNIVHNIKVERTVDALGKYQVRYWISARGVLLSTNWYVPNDTKSLLSVPLTGTSAILVRIF